MSGPTELLDWGRMLADGVPFSDLSDAERQISDPAQWYDFWMARAASYEARGREQLPLGNRLTAGEFLWLASLSAHYAQFMWFHERGRRQAAQAEKVRLYNEAAPLLDPPASRIDVPFVSDGMNHLIPGFLRLPSGVSPTDGWPLLLLLGGTESTKEESRRFEELCLSRGMATYAFDGPGQGELAAAVPTQPQFERWASCVVDALASLPEIDSSRIGVLGRSLGAHYALRCAAHDSRFVVCVAWGPFWDMSDVLDLGPAAYLGDLYNAGYDGDVEHGIPAIQKIFDLGDIVGLLDTPTLILHGGKDRVISAHQFELLQEHLVGSHFTFLYEPEGSHCCHNFAEIYRPQLADFAASHLVSDQMMAAIP